MKALILLALLLAGSGGCDNGNQGVIKKLESDYGIELDYSGHFMDVTEMWVMDVDRDEKDDVVYFQQAGSLDQQSPTIFLDRLVVAYSNGPGWVVVKTNVYSVRGAESMTVRDVKLNTAGEVNTLLILDAFGLRKYRVGPERMNPFQHLKQEKPIEVEKLGK